MEKIIWSSTTTCTSLLCFSLPLLILLHLHLHLLCHSTIVAPLLLTGLPPPLSLPPFSSSCSSYCYYSNLYFYFSTYNSFPFIYFSFLLSLLIYPFADPFTFGTPFIVFFSIYSSRLRWVVCSSSVLPSLSILLFGTLLDLSARFILVMEDLGGSQFDGLRTAIRKKRSQTSRRPRPEPKLFSESHDLSPLSSIPVSDDLSKVSSDENTGDANFRGKMFNLNQCMLRDPSTSRDEDTYSHKKIKEDDGTGTVHSNGYSEDSTDYGQAVPQGIQIAAVDSLGNENKLKKVKLKVGGITRTIQAKPSSNGASNIGTSTKTARSLDGPRAKQKLVLQDIADHSPPDKKSGMQGIPWKDFSRGRSSLGKEETGKMAAKNGFDKTGEKSDPVRKSKRVPKRRVLDGAFDEDDNDDELRYLEKIRIPKVAGNGEFDEESTKKQRNLSRNSKGGNYEILDEVGKSSKEGKRLRLNQASEDTDYEEEEMPSDCEPGGKKKKQMKDPSGSPTEIKREITLTTRQRALLSSKDSSSTSGAGQIEFPNGLPPPPPRKQKEQLTEVEQQLKKAEAAQRRRMQNEKAARESQDEAIRKILGGADSAKKKREDKRKKQQEERAQAKAANAQLLAANTIRWVIGPSGTLVTFPQEMGLPKLFDPKPGSYPPPREKCAGPSCNNPYKYRDSKTKLPLCSLECYKAIHKELPTEAAC